MCAFSPGNPEGVYSQMSLPLWKAGFSTSSRKVPKYGSNSIPEYELQKVFSKAGTASKSCKYQKLGNISKFTGEFEKQKVH